jgi:hypothetical protein
MTASILPKEHDQVVDLSYDPPRKIDWVVRKDPQLQAELNGLSEKGKKLSPQVVNKVLARIKDL